MGSSSLSVAQRLLQPLGTLEKNIRMLNCRVVPSSFDPYETALRAFPRAAAWRWKSLAAAFEKSDSRTIMLNTPLFWQIESYVHTAREGLAALFVNEPFNIPVNIAAITLTNIDTVVLAAEDAKALSLRIVETGVPTPASWVLIHTAASPAWDTPVSLIDARRVVHEVHLLPGVPLLWQCEHLYNQSALFHVSDEFTWSISDSSTLITTKEPAPYTFSAFEIPFSLSQNASSCTCGENLFERTL